MLVAAALPTVYFPALVDAYILPRASIAIAGACLGTGLALLVPTRRRLGGLSLPLIAAAAAALVAFAFSASWPLSAIGGYTRYESFPMRLAYLGLLAVPVWLLRSPRTRTLVVVAVILGAALCGVEAISQIGAGFRPDGNLGNANLLGALVAMALPLCVSQMLRPGWTSWVAWACAGVMVWGLILSTSRSGAIAAFAGCLALAVLSLRGRWAAAAAAGAGVLVVVSVVVVLNSPLRDLNGDPGPTRVHLYQDALHMIAARPVFGWGEESTGLVFGGYLSGDWAHGVTFDRVHSGILDLAATQGLAGVLTTGWLLFVVGRRLWERRSATSALTVNGRTLVNVPVAAIAAALVAYTVWVLVNFDWAPVTAVFWLLAGTGWSVASAEEPDPPPRAWSTVEHAQRLAGALALTLVAVALGALPLVAEAWYGNGRSDLSAQVDPLQVQYRRALGEALIGQGSTADGITQLRMAASLGATDPALYVELGDAELTIGEAAQARADYRHALVIDPYWTPAQQRLAGTGSPGTA